MSKIRFTIGDSPIWHEIQMDFQLSESIFRDEHDLSYIIKKEQERLQRYSAKKVMVLDDFGNLKAQSDDILEWGKLEYKTNNQIEK